MGKQSPTAIFAGAMLLFALSGFYESALQGEDLVLIDGRSSYSLTRSADYLIDRSGSLSLTEVLGLPDGDWRHSEAEILNAGTNANADWLRIRIRNQSETIDRLLVWEFPWGNRAEIFILEAGRLSARHVIGIDTPITQREYRHRIPVLRLQQAQASEQEIYIRVKSTGTKVARFYLEDETSFLKRDQRHAFFFYLFLGALALMLAMNIVLAYSARSHGPLLYALVLLFFALSVAVFRSYMTEWFYPSAPEWRHRNSYIFGPLQGIAQILFWRWLLLLPIHAPRMDRALLVVAAAFVALILYALTPEPDFLILNRVGKSIFYAEAILLVTTALVAWRKGFDPAFYSVPGFICLQGSIAVYFLSTSGLIPINTWTLNSLYLGLVPEFIFFMLSVFSRMRFLQSLHPQGGAATEKQQVAAYREQVETREQNARTEKKYKKSKISALDSDSVVQRLETLVIEEKIFCDEDLSLARLSELLGISGYQLSEIINVRYGKNFFRYINEHRINEAQSLLKADTERPIQAIAASVGFNSLSSFNTEFKKITGTTPSRYRRGRES